jgi:hypothetical protein
MNWLIWAVLAWFALSILLGLALARAIRIADEKENNS